MSNYPFETFPLTKRVGIVNPVANLDARYGPWPTLNDALTGFSSVLREKGLTVAVSAVEGIVEYWYKDGIEDQNLVLKSTDIISTVTDYLSTNSVLISSLSTTNSSVFESNSTEPTLRITQTGSGHVFEAGDIEHPDSSPVIIDQYGTLVVGASSAPGSSPLSSRNAVFVSSSTSNKRVTEFRNHGENPTNFAEIRLVRSRAQTSNDFDTYPLSAGDALGAYATVATTGSFGSRIITTNKNDSASGTVSGCRVEFQAHVADVGLISTLTIDEDKVGIGTTAPNETLTVVGNISAAGAIYASDVSITDNLSSSVHVTDFTTSKTFLSSDTSRVFHFDTTTQPLCAIFPSDLPNGFNVAVMNTGTNNLRLSAAQLNSVGVTIGVQYGGAFVYKDNNQLFAVGRL